MLCRRIAGAREARHAHRRLHLLALLATLTLVDGGCANFGGNRWVSLRSTPKNPLSDALGLVTKQGPKPTPRTMQLLRRYDLEKKLGDKAELVAELSEIDRREPHREHVYALAEISYVGAKKAEQAMKPGEALEWYGASVAYAYQYLFDEKYATPANPYDPEFRGACDLYNAALEGTLRLVQQREKLRPGGVHLVKTPNHMCELSVELMSAGWHPDDFDHVEFVSDFEVHGLRNHYHTFGLGVPLIAVRKHHDVSNPAEQFYPPNLSFAVTALLRIKPDQSPAADGVQPVSAEEPTAGPSSLAEAKPTLRCVLELHDPLDGWEVAADRGKAPLETDLSTPLAHFLSQPELDDNRVSTLGLLKPGEAENLSGLYMLEPYRPDKIPVVMVHGLWSSPVTWMEMFNDLRSDPAVRRNYQFWFYLYPSGQPFWRSAMQMREDLARMRLALDPQRRSPALDQMVLVGHSMGGLVSKLQTVDSGNAFWATVSDKPFGQLQSDETVRKELAETFFFAPNPSIRQVITIGTPHRGSEFSNDVTQWLGRSLIRTPMRVMQWRDELQAQNPKYFRGDSPLQITNSIDSLAPSSPILPVLLEAPAGPWVHYHNIIGQAPRDGVKNKVSMWLSGEGDGVVSLASAQLDQAESQIVVPADHMTVHRHPQSIIEVRRILMQNLAELQAFPGGGVQHASAPPQAPGSEGGAPLPLPVAIVPGSPVMR
jgi:pimeloyl-ACP methyl ester carboxylesterase